MADITILGYVLLVLSEEDRKYFTQAERGTAHNDGPWQEISYRMRIICMGAEMIYEIIVPRCGLAKDSSAWEDNPIRQEVKLRLDDVTDNTKQRPPRSSRQQAGSDQYRLRATKSGRRTPGGSGTRRSKRLLVSETTIHPVQQIHQGLEGGLQNELKGDEQQGHLEHQNERDGLGARLFDTQGREQQSREGRVNDSQRGFIPSDQHHEFHDYSSLLESSHRLSSNWQGGQHEKQIPTQLNRRLNRPTNATISKVHKKHRGKRTRLSQARTSRDPDIEFEPQAETTAQNVDDEALLATGTPIGSRANFSIYDFVNDD